MEGLGDRDAFAGLGVPLLLIAESGAPLPRGVSGQAAEGSGPSADSYALVLARAGPGFVDDPAFVERAWPVVDLFVQYYLFDIFTAGDVLEDWPATGEDRFLSRKGSS
jgi:hypothetical protein